MEHPLLKYLAFVKTVEAGIFTKAAETLHYAQSSVSKMVADLENEWGMTLLEHGGKTEVSDLLHAHSVHPDIRFTTWEDFAIMAMVEKGMGISILPELILKRVPYRIAVRPLAEPYYRTIGLAMKSRAHLSPAVEKFMEYLPFRETEENGTAHRPSPTQN